MKLLFRKIERLIKRADSLKLDIGQTEQADGVMSMHTPIVADLELQKLVVYEIRIEAFSTRPQALEGSTNERKIHQVAIDIPKAIFIPCKLIRYKTTCLLTQRVAETIYKPI